MSRPARNRLLVGLIAIAALLGGPRLPDVALWVASAVATPVVVLALWVSAPFRRARGHLAAQRFEDAAMALAEFDASLASAAWKRALAGLAVGLYTSDAVAAGRNTLGAVRLEQGALDEAATHFRAAVERDPLYAVPWGNLAVLAAMRGDAAGAEELRQKASSLGFKPKRLAAVIHDKLASSSLSPREGRGSG